MSYLWMPPDVERDYFRPNYPVLFALGALDCCPLHSRRLLCTLYPLPQVPKLSRGDIEVLENVLLCIALENATNDS